MIDTLPQIRDGIVTRPRLIQLLLRWSDYRLVNIVAPAGFGKSTIAALWLRDIGQSPEVKRTKPALLKRISSLFNVITTNSNRGDQREYFLRRPDHFRLYIHSID